MEKTIFPLFKITIPGTSDNFSTLVAWWAELPPFSVFCAAFGIVLDTGADWPELLAKHGSKLQGIATVYTNGHATIEGVEHFFGKQAEGIVKDNILVTNS